ncbi:D-amino-acid oxidase [Tolypocladium paradoxum]|uniref:D-amino-acid oxidase n=1 Tax=Tolypocladium paradoxum TaxID=94208 RepID=A0A2S4KYS8_9HYPO|nr:D-amino-acid oxidase [Tolypocladium paradoxum]
MSDTIVVIGAGVIGLTSALLLSKSKANTITVVAKHMPGDYDIEYASPFAGANMLPCVFPARDSPQQPLIPQQTGWRATRTAGGSDEPGQS